MQYNSTTGDEELVEKIQALVSAIRADSNPEELDRIKKLIKKNVPFSLRSYFSAYLLRASLQVPARKEKEVRKPRVVREERTEAPAQKPQEQKKPRRELPPDARTLYINLGKKGRVFARELVGLLTEDGSITKDDIYLIRLHDTYSFISMNEENCAKAIAALQGRDYNGRTIQINISNKERKTQEENADQNRA